MRKAVLRGSGRGMGALAVVLAVAAGAQEPPAARVVDHAGGNVVVAPQRLMDAGARAGSEAAAEAASPVLATYEGGQVTLADLETRVEEDAQRSPVPFDPADPANRQRVEATLRRIAFERLVLARAERDGVEESSGVRAYVDGGEREVLLAAANRALVDEPAQVSEEEMLAYLTQEAAKQTLPETAAFRFMFFDPGKDGGKEGWQAAKDKAVEAHQALEAGEDFAEVARRLATTPVDGVPGKLYGPLAFEGRMPKPVAEALRSTPAGSSSKPVESTTGFIIVQVVEYLPERNPEPESLRRALGRDYQQKKREERRVALLAELKEKHPWEFHEPPGDAADDFVVARVQGRPDVTLEMLQGMGAAGTMQRGVIKARLESDETTSLPRVVEEELLLAAFEAEDGARTAELEREIAKARDQRRMNTVLRMLRPQTMEPVPTKEDLEAFLAANPQQFTRALVDATWLQASFLTLSAHLGSTDKLVFHRWAEDAAARVREGAALESLKDTVEGWGGAGDEVVTFAAEPVLEFPLALREAAKGQEPGTVSAPIMTQDAVGLLLVTKREAGVPPMDKISWEVRRAWQMAQPRPRPVDEELLEEAGFEVTADLGLLGRDADGALVLGTP